MTGAPPVATAERAFLVVGALVLVAAVVGTRWGVFAPDTRPDLYQQPGRFLASSVQAWVGGASGLGQGNFNAGAAPVAAVIWVIRGLGASPWLAVRIWRVLLLLGAAWGIRRYLAVILGARLTVAARVIATTFWVANPYVIVAGSTTPILLPYALLPWTLVAFVHATRAQRSWRWPALVALAFFAQTGLNAGVVPFLGLAALPGHLAHAWLIEHRPGRELLRVVVRSGMFACVVSLYWMLPSVLAAGTGAGIAGATEDPRDVARTSSYAEVTRLLGNWPLYGRSGARLFLDGYTSYLTNVVALGATFLVPVAVGWTLWRSRARERLLVVTLLATALPVMVGMFPPDRPHAFGRVLGRIFDTVPATLAFRTTNKVGAVVVLAEALALAIGVRTWQSRTRGRGRGAHQAGAIGAAVLLFAISMPMWDGSLYPLGYRIPGRWTRAATLLDTSDPGARIFAVPGGTGGNYRWGMRSPDDLFPSLFRRPVVVRNSVVGRGDPAGNYLAGFDTAMAQGALPAGATSSMARSLGAADVLVRNDLLSEEIGGAAPSKVSAQVASDPGLAPTRGFGNPGTDTMPGGSGPATKVQRDLDPFDAAVHPLELFSVLAAQPVIRAAPVAEQVLVDGDGAAPAVLAGVGILDGTQTIRYLGSLDQDELARTLREGARIVLTDTNRRRAWDINRVANTTSPTIPRTSDIDAGNGSTLTLWPDDPAKQTVTTIEGARSITADRPGFGLQPFGRPSHAFDGDPTTSWITGGLGTAEGARLRLRLSAARTVRRVSISARPTEPSRISAVEVRLGDTTVVQPFPAGDAEVSVAVPPTWTDQVTITILGQTQGANPVGLSEVRIDDLRAAEVTRLPSTLDALLRGASGSLRGDLADRPLDVLLTRARGEVGDVDDDEEANLDRRFSLPDRRSFTLTGALGAAGVDVEALAAARRGEAACQEVAAIDGNAVSGRIISTPRQLLLGDIRVAGCGELDLGPGPHELRSMFGWRFDQLRLADRPPTAARRGAIAPSAVRVQEQTPTRVTMRAARAGGDRYLRLGRAFDDRWELTIDGRAGGPAILVDGYSVGWRIDGQAHDLVATFGPQRAVTGTFAVSAAALVGVTAIAVLPAPARRRRVRGPVARSEPAAGGPGDGR